MENKDYNISPETVQSMWKFFMKTSVPRLIKKQREAKQDELESDGAKTNKDESSAL